MKRLILIIIGLCLCTALYADMNTYIIGSGAASAGPDTYYYNGDGSKDNTEAVFGDYATGYSLEYSSDAGATWSDSLDVGAIAPIVYTSGELTKSICTYTWQGLPDGSLILVRVTAYNNFGATTNTLSGAWINTAWQAPESPVGGAIE